MKSGSPLGAFLFAMGVAGFLAQGTAWGHGPQRVIPESLGGVMGPGWEALPGFYCGDTRRVGTIFSIDRRRKTIFIEGSIFDLVRGLDKGRDIQGGAFVLPQVAQKLNSSTAFSFGFDLLFKLDRAKNRLMEFELELRGGRTERIDVALIRQNFDAVMARLRLNRADLARTHVILEAVQAEEISLKLSDVRGRALKGRFQPKPVRSIELGSSSGVSSTARHEGAQCLAALFIKPYPLRKVSGASQAGWEISSNPGVSEEWNEVRDYPVRVR